MLAAEIGGPQLEVLFLDAEVEAGDVERGGGGDDATTRKMLQSLGWVKRNLLWA